MKINWKIRFKNRAFLGALLALAITFVYDVLTLLGIAPGVDESVILTLSNTVLTVLAALGIVVDPTTEGIEDSDRAMTY